jgi:hypothetical protein
VEAVATLRRLLAAGKASVRLGDGSGHPGLGTKTAGARGTRRMASGPGESL